MAEAFNFVIYFFLGISCYVFVAYSMHIDRGRLVKFLLVLALFMSMLFLSPVYKDLMTPYVLRLSLRHITDCGV